MSDCFALNRGRIISTFALARKAREFWQASYLFSHLMKCLLYEFEKNKTFKLLSPQIPPAKTNGAGVYPDRAFFKSNSKVDKDIIQPLINKAVLNFEKDTKLDKTIVRDYFNIMTVSGEYATDGQAIEQLNKNLNYLELSVHATLPGTVNEMVKYLRNKDDSPLFWLAFGSLSFPNQERLDLEELAQYRWKKFHDPRKSHHNYVCIVQADGDKVGTVIQSLLDGKLPTFSEALANFAQNATQKIRQYGGLPVYSGGDDLLFIAPIWGGETEDKRQSIFDLLDDIDKEYETLIQKELPQLTKKEENSNSNNPKTSMSYGLSITYHKYPLYETWETARELLFYQAKQYWKDEKNTIAWQYQKHSGAIHKTNICKSHTEVYKAFKELLNITVPENIVTAVAHKIYANEGLLSSFEQEQSDAYKNRLNAFFKHIVDIEGKDKQAINYIEKVKELMIALHTVLHNKSVPSKENTNKIQINLLAETVYSMLRTAKFFNGEEEKL